MKRKEGICDAGDPGEHRDPQATCPVAPWIRNFQNGTSDWAREQSGACQRLREGKGCLERVWGSFEVTTVKGEMVAALHCEPNATGLCTLRW